MKRLDRTDMIRQIVSRRKALHLTQTELAQRTGMNRSVLSNLENGIYMPSIEQLELIAEELSIDITSLYKEDCPAKAEVPGTFQIAIAGVGYVGLSLAVLLSQHHRVTAVDIVPDKVDKVNRLQSPIRDEYIERFFSEAS